MNDETTDNSTSMEIDDRCAVNKISVDRCQLLDDLNDDCKEILEMKAYNHFNMAAVSISISLLDLFVIS